MNNPEIILSINCSKLNKIASKSKIQKLDQTERQLSSVDTMSNAVCDKGGDILIKNVDKTKLRQKIT